MNVVLIDPQLNFLMVEKLQCNKKVLGKSSKTDMIIFQYFGYVLFVFLVQLGDYSHHVLSDDADIHNLLFEGWWLQPPCFGKGHPQPWMYCSDAILPRMYCLESPIDDHLPFRGCTVTLYHLKSSQPSIYCRAPYIHHKLYYWSHQQSPFIVADCL